MKFVRNMIPKAWHGNERNILDLEAFAQQHSIAKAVRAHNDLQTPIGLRDVFVLKKNIM